VQCRRNQALDKKPAGRAKIKCPALLAEILPEEMPDQRPEESKRWKNGMLFGFAGIAPISTCDESKKPAQKE
jgi:hypothetical protein